ncbi:hypothetical protein AB5N19_08315 [Seiridium cardinale]
MANDDEQSPHPQGSFNPTPRHTRTSTLTSSRSHASYETGESSTTASDSFTAQDQSLMSSAQPEHHATDKPRHAAEDGRRRSHRPRPTGGFLLADPVFDEKSGRPNAVDRDDGRRRSRIPVDSRRAKSPRYGTPGRPSSSNDASPDHRSSREDMARVASEKKYIAKGRGTASSRIPSPRTNEPVDLDSTQIVSMALNLSESRRMAQRRNVSSPMPPRLAQVPDSPVGGSLKQHLQQQRRTSRNISPKPEKATLTPRNVSVSGGRLTSPLQTSFDPDTSYTYHFSSSTLNRAQKAKEHFELMAQYRRLLNLVPPLQYKGQASRPSTSSPPTSPISGSSSSYPFPGAPVTLGRPYNPLQYIRNRKVRARERQAIDGEAQGFSDVNRVTDWVDQAATAAATSPLQPENSPSIPTFSGAHAALDQNTSKIPIKMSSTPKPKRPRIDWFIQPADMVADLYWVEQDDNKSLIEDRHYTRIFPSSKKAAVKSRPLSQETNDQNATMLAGHRLSQGGGEGSGTSADRYLSDSNAVSRTDTEISHVSTRDRARQKLHELKGLHHRHNSPAHSHHDFLHLRKSSYSDTSDSEHDRRKRERSGTVSANSKAVLEKQMNEMLAKEALATKEPSSDGTSVEQYKPFRPTLMTPEKSPGPSAFDQVRADVRIEGPATDRSDRAQVRYGSPGRSGRPSLEVPRWNTRASMDLDTSAPPSPDLRASRNGTHYIPAIGMDLSPPSSRPESPVRNPFSKVKSIFRDRSRDRANGSALPSRDEKLDSSVEETEQFTLSPATVEGIGSPARRRSKSPAPRVPRVETHKSHKSMGSLRASKEDQIGLRNILKGSARIDDLIRGGVTKVSDFLWRKDQEGEGASSGTSSDESDIEPVRGRARISTALAHTVSEQPHERHQGTNYLDTMPSFKPASGVANPAAPEDSGLVVPLDHPTQPQSRRSNRFEELKPPRIDVLNASPTSSPVGPAKPRDNYDTTFSDSDSQSRDSGVLAMDGARKSAAQLNALLSLPAPSNRPRDSHSQSRHWSISDRSPSPRPSTQLSKREVARLRALALSSGIKAMEIARRAAEPHPISNAPGTKTILPIPWSELSAFVTDAQQIPAAAPQLEVYATTAHVLISNIRSSDASLEKSASTFVNGDMRQLHNRVDALHARVATELIDMTRRAADEADECSRDMVDSQRLKVKRVVDTVEKMLRRRRRRFRWARRGGWLMVEWALVGFMWYVWFVVMILRIFFGVGRGLWNGMRWLLWL